MPHDADDPMLELRAVRSAVAIDDVEARKWQADVAARLFGADADTIAIGRYEIVRRIGGGAMGLVYEAIDPKLERRVAIKLLRPGAQIPSERAADLLAREAKTLARLSHPNVLPVYDVGMHDEQVFIALELVVGSTLRQWLAASPRTSAEIVDVFVQAGRGLAAAHAAGLVHRDFKPDNVLIGDDGRVRVSDFGIARRLDAPLDETQREPDAAQDRDDVSASTHHGAGTPGYMAPEQFLGDPIDARTDQFAYCVALHEALWGVRPFAGSSREKLAANVIAGRRRTPPKREGVASRLQRVIARGLQVDPARRYANMPALLADLAPHPGRKPLRWTLGLAGAAALGAALALVRSDRDPASASPCADAATRIAMVWTPGRAEQIADVFAATTLPYADPLATRVTGVIDAWAEAWTQTYAHACDAVTDDVQVRRLHCLQSRLLELQSLLDVLIEADAAMVEHAGAAATSLIDPAECLYAGPGDAAGRSITPDKAEAIRWRIAEAKAVHDAGRLRDAAPLARAAARHAQDSGDPVLAAEALLVAGIAERDLLGISSRNEAQATSYAAVLAAEMANRPDLRARALVEYLIVTQSVGEHERALEWVPKVRAAVRAVGDPPDLVGRIEYTIAIMHAFAGDVERARQHAAAALAAFEDGAPQHRRHMLAAHNLLGELTFGTGEYEAALPHYERALAVALEHIGPRHRWIADEYGNMAEVHFHAGRYERAKELFSQSYAIREESYGRQSIWAIHSKLHVADVELRLGTPADALALYEQALDDRNELRVMIGDRPKDDEALALYRDLQAWDQEQWIHNGLALAYLELGQIEQAEEHARHTFEGRLPDHKHHPDQIGRIDALCRVRLVQRRWDDAHACYETVRARWLAEYPADHPILAFSSIGLGEASRGRDANAIEPARAHYAEALRVREGRPGSMPRDLGDIRRALAELTARSDPKAARALAAAAGDDYRRAADRRPDDLPSIAALLRTLPD